MNDRLYFQPDIETLPAEKLREMQLERFRRVVEWAIERSPFYRKLYKDAGVEPKDIKSFGDIRKVPILDRETVQSQTPLGHLCVEAPRLRELHSTTGSRTIEPILVAATQRDIDYWADLNARALWMVGMRPGGFFLNTFHLGLNTWGFGHHYGALKLGLLSIPIGASSQERLVDILLETGATGMCGTPSSAFNMVRYVKRRKIDLTHKSSCEVALLGAEPWTWATRERIEDTLGLTAFDHYGMSEFLGPGMSCECEVRDRRYGMHTWADAFLCECIDPRTKESVLEEEEGELVWTSFAYEGTPLIRYRSRDLSAITWKSCDCGRTHPRISAIKGRTDDAVSLEGIILYPSQIEEGLLAFEEAGSHFRIVVDTDKRGGDFYQLRVELQDKALMQDEQLTQGLARKMKDSIKQSTGLAPRDVELLPPGELRKGAGGSQEMTAMVRVEDKRLRD